MHICWYFYNTEGHATLADDTARRDGASDTRADLTAVRPLCVTGAVTTSHCIRMSCRLVWHDLCRLVNSAL